MRGALLFFLLSLSAFAADSVRVVDGARVELWNGSAWEDSGMRPPPEGITYKAAHVDGAGNLAVELGGTGKGFNFKLKGGPVIVASKLEWAAAPPAFVELSPNPGGAGFIGKTADGKLFRIEPPASGHRHFTAVDVTPPKPSPPPPKKAPGIAVTGAELTAAIRERRDKVVEFKELAKMAEERGLRLFLFGGTAAGFAHYVKWDMLREKGDAEFLGARFDYEYSHIYRHNQDLDLPPHLGHASSSRARTESRRRSPSWRS